MVEDFCQIDGCGNVEIKISFVEGLVLFDFVIDFYVVEDFDLCVYGDMVLFSGCMCMIGCYQGQVFKSYYCYIDIYVKQCDGSWKIVSVQISCMFD